ncbi:Non-reducing polyketide synthase PKS16 [Cladobotryum mycophilum]|uniref:Non-reducing polyketide synthase PKS16 n=1 Tax=Cladobotryum mycophilum TaxID=491253 RepID=A0ABR0SHQ4_9HYPO
MTSITMPKHLLLFGDQSSETFSSIQNLVRRSKYVPAARRFLQEATDAIQLEFSLLGHSKHGWSGSLDSLLALAEEYENSSGGNIIVSAALMCADEDPTILGSSREPVDIMAFCGGLLPASVAMAAKDTSQLFELSRQVISIIIRLAHEISRRSKQIEDRLGSWGRTYTGLPLPRFQEILDQFHEEQGIPKFKRIAIGVIAKDWVTLIGSPSSLEHLTSWSFEIMNASHIKTEVNGAIHTSLTPRIDVAKILGNSPLLNYQIDHTKARMFSPGSLKQYKHLTLGDLLTEAIEDIIHNVLYVTDSIQACVSTLDARQPVKLSLMGPSNQFAAVKQALQKHGIFYELNQLQEVATSDLTRGSSDLIAIVGMAGRFPGSDTVEDFWEDLLAGKCHIKEVPKSRFDVDDFFDASGEKKNSTTARHGAWLKNPGLFDHRLFNISPREAAQMDPGHRLILMVVYEALQAAGYSPDGSLANGSSRIASYFGQATNEWREVLNQKGADIYYVPGFSRAFGPGRLNYHFNWSGGAFSIDTACSTSATAVNLACSALIARECDMALAGGYSVINSPTIFSGLSRAGMLSATGGCRTYHDDADGYARGEGAGAVVLKRLEDALSDNDNILAVIRGSVRTHSPTATSMTHPSAAAQEATYKEVLRQSGLSAEEIAYVEMHGTGTQAGDVEEMNSVLNVFAKRRQKDNTLTIGAVKAAVGHGEGAAGVTSLIKVIMMLRERQIPPQPNWPFKLNQNFPPLAQLNVNISTKTGPLRPSPNSDKRVKMLVNSFDASGGNVSLAIEEAPPRHDKSEDTRAWHVVAISARTPTSLQKNRERLLDYLERHPDTKIADVAYTTTARRMHEPLRIAYTGSSTRRMISQLRDDVGKQSEVPKTKPKPGSRVFLFTGQGSHYSGMGADLFRESPVFRETISSYQEMATMIGLPAFIELIANPSLDLSSQSTVQIQLAIVALEIALAHTMKIWGITPDVVIGHSLGEYAALCVAGVLSVSDTLFLVGMRAALMEKHIVPNTHAMLATSMAEQDIAENIFQLNLQSCNVACANAPSITVASGTISDIEKLGEHLKANGEKTTLLPVPYGFHSGQIEPILEELRHVARSVVFSRPRIPIISTLTGQVERDESTFSPLYLTRQAREKVNFVGALDAGRVAGLYNDKSLWVEIGPTPVCLGLARKTLGIAPSQALPALKSGDSNWKTVSHILKQAYESGVSVNWTEFHRTFKDSVSLLNLPTYAFDCRDFWTTYTEPVASNTVTEPTFSAAARPAEAIAKSRNFASTSLQYIEDEAIEGQTINIVFGSKISEPQLLEAIRGHVVNGQAICPLSVFQDMALTAANYLYERMKGQFELPAMSIRNVEMSQALVATEATLDTTVRVKSSYNTNDGVVHIELRSERNGKPSLHGKCEVVFDTNPNLSLNMSQSFLLKSRIGALRDQVSAGKAHQLMKPVVYQLFSGLVAYSPPYQALQEVILDAGYNDAIGTVKLSDVSGLGQFHTSPYWIDAVIHLVGFVVNSGLRYPQDLACLVTGFDAWRSTKELAVGETYTVYACMQDVPNSHFVQGDCYVFHGEDLIQATLGIKFLKLKKTALSRILEVTPTSQGQPRAESLSTVRQFREESLHVIADDEDIPHVQWQKSPELHPRKSSHDVTSGDESAGIIKSVLSIISSESGCNVEDMTDETQFTDLGIDSVMAISILAALTRKLGLDLPAAFFLQHDTIGESKRALGHLLGSQTAVSDPQEPYMAQNMDVFDAMQLSELKRLRSCETLRSTPASSIPASPLLCDNLDEEIDMEEQIASEPESQEDMHGSLMHMQTKLVSSIVQYQGVSSPGSRKLFFIADETGSTFECIQLPSLGPNIGVYGVEPPLMGDFADVEINVQELASVYKSAIQKDQASGPYLLAGASAGAVFAFEVARLLLEAGEKVDCLVLLDCPSPRLERLQASDSSASSSWFARPDEEEHIKKMATIFAAYSPGQISSSLHPAVSVQILSRDEQSNSGWQGLIPTLQTHQSDMESGSFFQIPMVNTLSRIIGEIGGLRISQ